MNRKLMGAVVALVLATPMAAAAQEAESSPVKVTPRGYAQVQFNTTSIDEQDVGGDEVAGSSFEFRRVRVGFDVKVRDWITGVIETDIAMGKLKPTDVFVNLQLSPAFGIRAGQFKKPFSAIELTSSSKLTPIERNTRIRGLADVLAGADEAQPGVFTTFDDEVLPGDEHGMLEGFGYLGRDIGAALNGRIGALDYQVGVFNGSGANTADDNDSKSYAGRLVLHPAASLPLKIGAAGSYHELGSDLESTDGAAFEGDVEWGDFHRPGLHALGEITFGDNLARPDASLLGSQLWLSWFAPVDGARIEGVEPLFRASWGDPDTDIDGDDGLLLTPGVNFYFFGRNRLMVNWDLYMPGHDALDNVSAFRTQLQLYL